MWCDASMFSGLARLLAPRARVLVPDLRAHGRSEVPEQSWSVADLAEDLAALLDELGVGPVILAGFSMGGMAAVEFAVRFPARVTGLVLIGSSAGAEEPFRKLQIKSLARLIDLTGPASFLPHESSKATFSPRFRRTHRDEVRRWESVVRAMPGLALSQALRAVGGRRDLLSQVGQINVPVAIIAGDADKVVRPRLSKVMHQRIPGSQLVILPGVGHAVPTERPEAVAQLIEPMLPPRP
jgi:pimeloyl-ACP methyl ester carboxylesterase